MDDPPRTFSVWRALPWLVGPLTVVFLYTSYVVAPAWFSKYMITAYYRETQAIEITTFLAALLSSFLLAWVTLKLFRRRPPALQEGAALARLAHRWGAFGIAGSACAATFFLAGEEVNWGQTFLHWNVSELDKPEPTNLHNNDSDLLISVNTLGSIWLIVMFIGLPLAWRLRHVSHVPESWRPVIAEWFVAFTIIVGDLWQLVRDFYDRPPEPGLDPFWDNFVWLINEQKEMIVALALLMYAIGRVRAVQRIDGGSPSDSTDNAEFPSAARVS